MPLLSVVTTVTAQQVQQDLLALNQTATVARVDGELGGFAPRYKVRLGADGFEFTAALGRAAVRNATMTIGVTSIGRADSMANCPAVAPTSSGTRVEYDRGVATERCDVGVTDMAWSFLFIKRPAGSGDLVVRGRLHTDLTITEEPEGLRFEQPGVGGFHMTRVVGIDANGERVDGTLQVDGDRIELSLPAAFVDRAALPFVLDPLIGSAFTLGLLTQPIDVQPRAAFDATTDSYLVVWQGVFSLTDVDVYGQVISRAGSLVGTRIPIAVAAATVEHQPDVANVNPRSAFVVVYTSGLATAIVARGVSTAGTVSAQFGVSTVNAQAATVGGDSVETPTVVPGAAVCVWRATGLDALQATAITVQRNLSLTVGAIRTFETGVGAGAPRISKGGGGTRRFALAYQRGTGTTSPWLIVVDLAGTPITSPLPLGPGGMLARTPAVDGDGSTFVAAWDDDALGQQRQIVARRVEFAGGVGGLVAGPIAPIANAPAVDDRVPSVLWTGGSALVAWWQSNAGNTAQVRSIDPFSCTGCEGTFLLGPSDFNSPGTGCAAAAGGGPADDALLVWNAPQASNPNNSDIIARFWRSADGTATTVANGCGLGGVAHATCLRVPNPDFAHRLRGARPNTPAFLLQSLGQESDVCGSCTRVPALAGAVALFVTTDFEGNAVVRSAIPNNPALRGLVQFEQWLTLSSTGACATFQVELSSALRLVLE
ncbi:MAG: hypothetical protein IPK26_09650 [Planctomycetes bacterium]|nr:hypothetical protein [Planctomycetota bacterium]